MKKETEQKVDIDYADRVVPEEGKKGFVTMFMIMLWIYLLLRKYVGRSAAGSRTGFLGIR